MPVVATKHQQTGHPSLPHVESQDGSVACSLPKLQQDISSLKSAWVLASDLNELERARTFVRSICSRLPASIDSEEVVDQLELAITEAVTNVIRHAYHERPGQSILLEAEANDEQVEFRLYHHGEAFDPVTVPSPTFDGSREHGFGLFIIGQCVSRVTYTYDEGKGNGILLLKRLQPEKGNTKPCNS